MAARERQQDRSWWFHCPRCRESKKCQRRAQHPAVGARWRGQSSGQVGRLIGVIRGVVVSRQDGLCLVAARRRTITSGEVAVPLGLEMGWPPDRDKIAELLGEISAYEHAKGRPLVSAEKGSVGRVGVARRGLL